MENSETLHTVAELAVGVLGFSGIVAFLGRRSAGEWAPVDRFRFLNMIHNAALVLVLSLIPFAFHSADFSPEATWAWCSGIGALLWIFMVGASLVLVPPPQGAFVDSGTSKIAVAYSFPASFVAAALLLSNATGIGLSRSATPYLVSTLLLFGVTVVLFIRLLHTALDSRRAA